jgi:fatty-acyl-CoA synthase
MAIVSRCIGPPRLRQLLLILSRSGAGRPVTCRRTTELSIAVSSPDPDRNPRALDAWRRALERTAPIPREPKLTLPMVIERLARERGAAAALIAADSTLSYHALAAQTHRYSRWAQAQGLAAGAVVCIVVDSCADYLPLWLGITRTAAVAALVNPQLTGELLSHALGRVAPSHVIASAGHAAAVRAAAAALPGAPRVWVHDGSHPGLDSLAPEIARQADQPLSERELALPSLASLALYIYTSGTSGPPKAARVSHYRLMQWSHWFAGLMDVSATDRMYNCLPLYHSVGGVVACGATLVGGGAVVLRPRFSASTFWRDVVAERCTLFQYIGELCRYLVQQPPTPAERQHTLRLACGNGLRQEVWRPFQERFAIPRILEYYASTEGNFSLYNCDGEPGAVGRIPGFLAHRLPVALIRHDAASDEPKRGADGYCERCAPDEPGEAIAPLAAAPARAGAFEGYADPEASARKLLHDVFRPGDAWYRSGDLLRRDRRGFYYFVDRIGDSYRWKGENVSAAEVWAALAQCQGVIDGTVYGVAVPGRDGRAGMAALVVNEPFDWRLFRRELDQRLPPHARPVFVRLLAAVPATGTFRARSAELRREGLDPAQVHDPLYVADAAGDGYRPLDDELRAAIGSGAFRL